MSLPKLYGLRRGWPVAGGLGLTPSKGGGAPFGAVFIGGVPVTIGGVYPVIGGN